MSNVIKLQCLRQHYWISGIQHNMCSFTWTIENFSFLPQKIGDKVQTENFMCCDSSECQWYMSLYPIGRAGDDENHSYFALHFFPPTVMSVCVDYKIYLRRADNSTFWKYKGSDTFVKDKAVVYKLIKFDEIKEKLINDILKLHIELTVVVQKEQMIPRSIDIKFNHFSSTRAILEKHTFSWKVPNFHSLMKLTTKSISSATFFQSESSKWKWHLTLKTEPEKEIDIALGLIAKEKPQDVRHPVQYRIVVKNSCNRGFKTFSDKVLFKTNDVWYTIGKKKALLDWFIDGSMHLEVDILDAIGTESMRKSVMVSHQQNHCKLLSDLENMLKSGKQSDIDIFVTGKTIEAHKAILANRSPVFDSMLRHDMMEKQERKIVIEDVSFETVMHMLRFMYTNKFTAEDDRSVVEVLKASDKYEMDDLKKRCEDYLIRNLNTTNAREILTCAETYQASSLKNEALSFVSHYIDDFVSSFNDLE